MYYPVDDVIINDCSNCQLSLLNNRYVHSSSGTATNYERMVTVVDINGEITCAGVGVCHRRVTATVAWSVDNNTRTYQVAVDLTDWR